MRRCQILLVHDNPLRLGLIDRFGGDFPEIDLVTRTSSSRKALEHAVLLRPDLVIMNLILPERSGMEAAHRLAAEAKAPWIIPMALHDDPEYHHTAEAAIGHGFLLKADLGTRLVPPTRS